MMCLKKKAPICREPSRTRRGVLLEGSRRVVGFRLVRKKMQRGRFAPAPQRLQSIEVIRQLTEILKRITINHNSRQRPACTVYTTTKQLARSTRPEIDCSHSHYKLVPLP